MKTVSAAIAALLIGATLSACGGGGDGDAKAKAEAAKVTAYCAAVKGAAPTTRKFNRADPDFKTMQDYFDLMRGLAKKAPSSVVRDWNVVDFDFNEIEKAAAAANLKFSSIPKLLKGKVPKDAKPAKFAALTAAFSYLTSVNLATAMSAISSHATRVCKVDLGQTAT